MEQLYLLRIDTERINNNFEKVKALVDDIDPFSVPYYERKNFLNNAYLADYYLGNYRDCMRWLSFFEFAEMDSLIYSNANFLFQKLGKQIVATTDSMREPADDEIVIVYGNYPDGHRILPSSSKVYRNASLYFDIQHTKIEYHPSWEGIDSIYIINVETRPDRLCDVLTSLCGVWAPLDRVCVIKGKKSDSPPIGCTMDHLSAITRFQESGLETCLILEDDIVFIDKETVWSNLVEFSKRRQSLDFNICFLAISKFREREPLDNLLSISKQCCTTSSAYILSNKTVSLVASTVEAGLASLQGGNDLGVVDCYWTKLDKLVFFKTKLAFQRPAYSSITGKINFNLD